MNRFKIILFFWILWVTMTSNGTERILATGRSMEPVWYAGDYLVIAPRKAEGRRLKDEVLKAGDDIVFDLTDGRRIAHRIVRVRGDWLITQGVNNDRVDPFFVHRSRVVGRVLKVEGRRMKAEDRVAEIFGNQGKETYATTK